MVHTRTRAQEFVALQDVSDLSAAWLGSSSPSEVFQVHPSGDLGKYVVAHTPAATGNRSLSVCVNGEHVEGSPFRTIVRCGPLDPTTSECIGGGLSIARIAEPAHFKIYARDAMGNKVAEEGQIFDVTVKNAAGIALAEATVENNADGVHCVQYSVDMQEGDVYVHVRVQKGRVVQGSPFTVSIASADVSKTSVRYHPNWENAFTVGNPAEICIISKSADGVAAFIPNADKILSVRLGSSVGAVRADGSEKGVYRASLVPLESGPRQLDVLLRGQHVQGSPQSVMVLPGRADAAHCFASGKGTERAVAGAKATCHVHTLDVGGNKLTSGGMHVTGTLRTAGRIGSCTVVDLCDGTYECSYLPPESGPAELSLEIGGTPIRNSPYAVAVEGADAATSSITAGCASLTKAGTQHIVGIHLRTSTGEPVHEADFESMIEVTMKPLAANGAAPIRAPIVSLQARPSCGPHFCFSIPTCAGHLGMLQRLGEFESVLMPTVAGPTEVPAAGRRFMFGYEHRELVMPRDYADAVGWRRWVLRCAGRCSPALRIGSKSLKPTSAPLTPLCERNSPVLGSGARPSSPSSVWMTLVMHCRSAACHS
jgi:hypothetical protein